jgi:hypothetical protein
VHCSHQNACKSTQTIKSRPAHATHDVADGVRICAGIGEASRATEGVIASMAKSEIGSNGSGVSGKVATNVSVRGVGTVTKNLIRSLHPLDGPSHDCRSEPQRVDESVV